MRALLLIVAALAMVPAASARPVRRSPVRWPFSATSPWNTPIGSHAAYDSGACSAQLASVAVTDVNAAQYSQPIFVARATDPEGAIVVDGLTIATVRIPAGATPAAGDDAHLDIVDPAHRYVDELYRARVTPTGFAADSHTRNRLRGPGVGTGGERAYGGSAIGGLIREWELRRGRIRHALAMALPRTAQRAGFVWPATAEDDGSLLTYGGAVPVGTLAAIPPGTDLHALGLSHAGLVAARALRDYGAYDVDSSDGLTLYAAPTAEGIVGPLRADLPKLQAALRCVTDNTPVTPGGGGMPRAAPAPPFAKRSSSAAG